jgi:hypothetical protein
MEEPSLMDNHSRSFPVGEQIFAKNGLDPPSGLISYGRLSKYSRSVKWLDEGAVRRTQILRPGRNFTLGEMGINRYWPVGPGMRSQHEQVSLSFPASRFTDPCPIEMGDLFSAMVSPNFFSADGGFLLLFHWVPAMQQRPPLAPPANFGDNYVFGSSWEP